MGTHTSDLGQVSCLGFWGRLKGNIGMETLAQNILMLERITASTRQELNRNVEFWSQGIRISYPPKTLGSFV